MGTKLPKRCFIDGCYGKSEKENNTHIGVFGVPKASLKVWQDIIPKDGLTISSKICSRHFEDVDIEKGRIIQDRFYPYSRWMLKPGAIPKLFLGHASTRPTVSSLSAQKSKTTQKKTCSSKTLPIAKDPICKLPRLLPKDISDIPNSSNSVPEPIVNVPDLSTSVPVPVGGPITHYIIVQDPISIPNETALKIKGGLHVNSALSNLATPTVQNDCMDVITSACSFDHSYVMVPPRSPTSVKDNSAPSSASRNTESPTCQQVQKNVAPAASENDFDHSYVIRPSSPQPVTEEESLHLDLAGYRDFINGVDAPTAEWTWSFNERNSNLVCSCHIFSYDGVMSIKSVKIISMTKVALYINGKSITPPDFKFEFRSKAELANIIEDFNYRKICQGILDESYADIVVTDKCAGNKEGNLWRSKMCMGISDSVSSILCSKCRVFRNYLRKIMHNKTTKKLKNTKEAFKLKLSATQQKLRRTKSKIEGLSSTIEQLRKERTKLYWNSFDVKVKLLKPKEQLVVKTMMAKATVNPGKNDRFGAMRYDSEFLKECVRIRNKSSAAYKHLRSEGILPLPSRATLLRMMKKIDLGDCNNQIQSHEANVSGESDFMELTNVRNECPASTDFNESVSPTPETILPHSKELTVSVQEEMIIEILKI